MSSFAGSKKKEKYFLFHPKLTRLITRKVAKNDTFEYTFLV